MNRFLQQVILSNTVQDYLITAGIILLVVLFKRFISRYLALLLSKLLRTRWKDFDEQKFTELVVNPLGVFVVVTVSVIALYRLHFPPALNFVIYKYTLQQILDAIGIMVQIIAFISLLLRIIDFIAGILERRAALTLDQSDNQLIVFFKDFLKVIIAIVGLLMILHMAFSYNISSLLTGLSIVGAAIALALRESLENLIASFIIFFDKPFTTGDQVKVLNVSGTVERIGLRSTRIRTDQKTYVTVPNKQMVDTILDNLSLRSQRKSELQLQLNLQTPSDKLQQVLSELRAFFGHIKEVESSNVLFSDINPNAFVIQVEFYTLPIDIARFNSIKQELNLFALQTLEKLDVKVTGAMAAAPPPPAH